MQRKRELSNKGKGQERKRREEWKGRGSRGNRKGRGKDRRGDREGRRGENRGGIEAGAPGPLQRHMVPRYQTSSRLILCPARCVYLRTQ